MTLVQPLAVFADVRIPSNAFAVSPDYLIGSSSNADPYSISTLELTDDDYHISTYSSLASLTNTIDYSGAFAWLRWEDSNGVRSYLYYPLDDDGHFRYVVPAGKTCTAIGVQLLKSSLPSPGTYNFSVDFASDFSIDYSYFYLQSNRSISNASSESTNNTVTSFGEYSSGDFYWSAIVDFGNLNNLTLFAGGCRVPAGNTIGGTFKVNFTNTSATPDFELAGVGNLSSDYQSDVSGSLSDISSSIGDMSESLDSAAENLEYISTSQNLIIQGIDNVIMHISDQLYAFWDQLYNLIHEPTYARLEQILLALKAIANNSDISAVVDTIEETTQQQITNDNSNTSKVESAVEKHGNFIIEGLKGLFIPSDEYFKSYFDDLYTYFSDRFGFLSFPIDLLVRLVDLFVNSSDKDCILTLPEFEISGEKLITEASFNLTEFLENDFAILLSSIRLVTSIGLIMAFVDLCQDKWNEVMRN